MFQKEKDNQNTKQGRRRERRKRRRSRGGGGKGEGLILQVLGIMLKDSCHLLSAINWGKLPSH